MSFNVNDPLAGILSDGSDDSFFDDDVLGKKKPPKKKVTPMAQKKNALFDLDDTDKTKPVANSLEGKSDIFDVSTNRSPLPFKRTDNTSKDSIKISHVESKPKAEPTKLDARSSIKAKPNSSADTFDILTDLIEPKKEKTLEKGKSSQSLLDDILGSTSTKTMSSNQPPRPVTAAKSQEFDINSILGKGDTKISSSKSLPQKQTLKEKEVKEKKEAVVGKKTKSSEDWLGIFQKEEDDEFVDDSQMPSWLVGGDSNKKKTEDKKATPKKEPMQEKPKEESNPSDEKQKVEAKKDLEPALDNLVKSVPFSNAVHLSNDNITAEGAALYLQEQESQIMVALQMKAQEEKLAAMQIRQKETQRVQREATQAQQSQLDAMLRRQAENRQQMQSIISAHQERITQRIKALLGTEKADNDDNVTHEDLESGDRKEPPHLREKKQLLQLVQSLQENHDKEIDLMETSYRRQLAFLEVSLSQSEDRMKEESDKIVKYYTEKMNWLEEHHHLYRKLTEDNLGALSDRHRAETEMLRQQHLENIRVLQEHHASLMESIKDAVKQEQLLIQDSSSFAADLKELVSDVKENKHHCQELIEKVQSMTENTERKADTNLQFRERQIDEMMQQLKKERENFDVEKSENRETIKMLESRLKQMTMVIEEESAALKQKRMEIEFEKATFNKQTEFAKNILKKQDEEIKMLREEIQKEYQEKTARIEEEKSKAVNQTAALVRDKSVLHNMRQELEKVKAELKAQLEEVMEDRSKLNVERQQIHMEEQRLIAKGRDLDLLAKAAIEKQTQAEKKYSEAEFIQRKYEERIRRIQEQVVSLNAREKMIAKEKVTLSRERLSLHNAKKQVEDRQQCSLCKSSQYPISIYEQSWMPESYLNAAVSKEFRSSDVTSAMNAIEQEMSHLMGRNLDLRHCAGIGDLRNLDSDGRQRVDTEVTVEDTATYKDYMDPKFMMLRLDVQKVIRNLDQTKKDDVYPPEDRNAQN